MKQIKYPINTEMKMNKKYFESKANSLSPETDTFRGNTTNDTIAPQFQSRGMNKTGEFRKWDLTDNYIMVSNLFDYEDLKQNENFGIKIYTHNPENEVLTKAVYKGELINAKRNGIGCMIYQSGRIYEGEWKNDKRDGKGYERYSNGNIYEGQFSKGRAHGKGAYSWITGESYDGQWVMGMKQGQGVWKTTDGDSYIGEWHQSKAHGYGVHIWK